jgi:hypothetical protein
VASAYAAVWRDRDGRAVKTTTDQFYCLEPKNLRDFAARTEDGEFEVPFRCRECLNCRRYDAWVLRCEMAETYKEVSDELWIVIVEADLPEHARLAARIRRSLAGSWEPCLYRLGVSAFALVARGERPALQLVRALRARTCRVEKVGRKRKPRQFRALTREVLGERAAYGAWTNRFYHRGRIRLPHERFVGELRGGIRKRHPEAKGGVRAWKRGVWLDASLAAKGSELMALILKRDGHLNGRKCTHEKCPPERCHYAHRAPAGAFSINQRPRVSAASVSLNDRISECAAGAGDRVPLGTTTPADRNPPAARPSLPKTYSNSVTGSRDAGSLHGERRKLRAIFDRWVEKGWLKKSDTT